MGYAIICDARQGWKLGINTLALVNRNKTKRIWWTSDNSNLIMEFFKKTAADFYCKKLFRNNARVVSYNTAVRVIDRQEREIMHNEAESASGLDYLLECGCKE